MAVGVIGCAALSVPGSWLVFLVVFVIAKVGYNASLIFYDSMLVDVTTPERMIRYLPTAMPGDISEAVSPLSFLWCSC